MRGGGEDTIDDIRDDVLAGHALLWVVWDEDGAAILAAGTTKLLPTKHGLICVITSIAGKDIRRWQRFMSAIELYAKSEGCSKIRAYGREGWVRILRGYTKPWVTIEKAL
jgi:hypothetical protein